MYPPAAGRNFPNILDLDLSLRTIYWAIQDSCRLHACTIMSLTIDDWYNCEPPENWYNGNNTRGLDEEVHAERQGLLWRALRVIFGSFLGEMRNPVRPQEDHAINLVAQPAPATPLDPEGATPPASSSAAEGHLEISNASEVPEEACLPVSTCAVVLQGTCGRLL